MHTHKETPLSLMQEHGVKPTANRILILKALLHSVLRRYPLEGFVSFTR